jgi:hypothetical protein
MTLSDSGALFRAATKLDESPAELLNGGAAEALQVLEQCEAEAAAAAASQGVESSAVDALWERAGARLQKLPEQDELFPAAAEAASLLYAAAWVLHSDAVTTEDLRSLM